MTNPVTKGTVWWDFHGTLVSRPFMWREAGCQFLERFVPDHQISPEQLRKAWRTGHFPATECHPELTPDLWWECVWQRYSDTFRELGCPLTEARQTLSVIRDDILDASRYSLFDDVVPVLERLHRNGWRHIMVSNHVPELEAIVAANSSTLCLRLQLSVTKSRTPACLKQRLSRLCPVRQRGWWATALKPTVYQQRRSAQKRFSFGQRRLSTDEQRICGRRWP